MQHKGIARRIVWVEELVEGDDDCSTPTDEYVNGVFARLRLSAVSARAVGIGGGAGIATDELSAITPVVFTHRGLGRAKQRKPLGDAGAGYMFIVRRDGDGSEDPDDRDDDHQLDHRKSPGDHIRPHCQASADKPQPRKIGAAKSDASNTQHQAPLR